MSKQAAEQFLGRTMSNGEYNSLLRATAAEATRNPQERAAVAGVILNRVRSGYGGGRTVDDILNQRNQFQAVTGTAQNPGPSSNYTNASAETLASVEGALGQHLSGVPTSWQNFTAASSEAYGPGTDISFRDRMQASGGQQIGGTIFGTVGGSNETMVTANNQPGLMQRATDFISDQWNRGDSLLDSVKNVALPVLGGLGAAAGAARFAMRGALPFLAGRMSAGDSGGENQQQASPISFGNVASGSVPQRSFGGTGKNVIQTGPAPISKNSGKSRGINKADVLEREGDNLNDIENILIDIREEMKTLVSNTTVRPGTQASKGASSEQIKSGFFSNRASSGFAKGAIGMTGLLAGGYLLNQYMNPQQPETPATSTDPNAPRTLSDGTVVYPDGRAVMPNGNEINLDARDFTAADDVLLAKVIQQVPGVNRAAAAGANATGRIAENVAERVATNPRTSRLATNVLEPIIRRHVLSKAGGVIAKSVPFAGFLVGAGEGLMRAIKGDLVGAGLSVASGVLGPGTALTIGTVDIAREIYKEAYSVDGVPANPEEDLKNNPDLFWSRWEQLKTLTWEALQRLVMGSNQIQEAAQQGYDDAVSKGTLQEAGLIGNDTLAENLSGAENNELLGVYDVADELKIEDRSRLLDELGSRARASGDSIMLEQVAERRRDFGERLNRTMSVGGRAGGQRRSRYRGIAEENIEAANELETMATEASSNEPNVVVVEAGGGGGQQQVASAEPGPITIVLGDEMRMAMEGASALVQRG